MSARVAEADLRALAIEQVRNGASPLETTGPLASWSMTKAADANADGFVSVTEDFVYARAHAKFPNR
ncbi:MAG: hypothetical protein QM756_43065 [Polyangiaceae bacterium]